MSAARRIWVGLACIALIGAGALAMHHAAIDMVQADGSVHLGPASRVIVPILCGVLVLLACRHLLMLGLAAYSHCTQSRPHFGPPTPLPFVSIIVPAFNEALMIRSVLESLLAIEYSRFEVIVVDDGSSDQTFLRALPYQRRRPDIEFRVLAKANGGKFDALNHGISHARGEIVICIDGDSILLPDALRYCVAHFEDASVGAVAGNVRVANRGTFWSMMQALEYIAGFGLMKRAQSAARVVTIVPGPLGAFRKSALAQVGGYDGDTFAEDFDLTLKLLSAGWHIVYEPRAVVITEAPERTLQLLRQRYRWSRGSLQTLLKRKRRLFMPIAAPLRCAGMWYLLLEYMGWPSLHVAAQLLFVGGGLFLGVYELIILWWLQLVLLECAVAAFCIAVEDDSPWLIVFSPLFRMVYVLIMDMVRVLASVEEFAHVGMSWDKIARLGTLKIARG